MQRPYRTQLRGLLAGSFVVLAASRPALAQTLPATRAAAGSLCVSVKGQQADSLLVLVRLSESGAAKLGNRSAASDLMLALSDPLGAIEAVGRGALDHCTGPSTAEPIAVAAFSVTRGTLSFNGTTTSAAIGSVTPIAMPGNPMPIKWGTGKMPIGVNVDIPGRGDTSFPFKDLMIQADFWTYIDVGANAGKLVPETTAAVPVFNTYNDPKWQMPDFAAFNPTYTECAAILTVVRQAAVPSGMYVITWDGAHAANPQQSAIQMGHLGDGGPANGIFTPYPLFTQVSPNRIELPLANPGEAVGPGVNLYEGALVLKVKSSSSSNPVRNIRVWLPGMEGAALDNMITPWMVTNCKPAHCIRFLNWVEHWNKPCAYSPTPAALTPWATRNYPGSPFQVRRDRVAIEHMAELARKAKADLWIPFHLGHLCDNGSTCTGRARVMGTMQILDQELHQAADIYMELGNELWNAGFFTVQAAAIDRLRNGSVMLDGSAGAEWSDTNPAVNVFGTYKAMVRCMSILWEWGREGLGTPTFDSRVVRAFAGGINSFSTIVSGSRATDGLNDVTPLDYTAPSVYVDPSYVSAGRIMIEDVDVLAAGGYMSVHGGILVPSAGQTLDQLGAAATPQQVLEAMQSRRLVRLAHDSTWKNGAAVRGKPYLNYEAGQHIVDDGHAWSPANDLAQTGGAGATSPLSMEGEYYANLDQLRAATTQGSPGVALSLHYTLRSRQTGYPSGTWGLGNDFQSPAWSSPKLHALQTWASLP